MRAEVVSKERYLIVPISSRVRIGKVGIEAVGMGKAARTGTRRSIIPFSRSWLAKGRVRGACGRSSHLGGVSFCLG